MAFYKKKSIQEMVPWTECIPMNAVSISKADIDNGSPRKGDMIAINANDYTDMWLVAADYFNENYELVTD